LPNRAGWQLPFRYLIAVRHQRSRAKHRRTSQCRNRNYLSIARAGQRTAHAGGPAPSAMNRNFSEFFAQCDHHGVPFDRVVLGEKKVHAIGQHVDDARAAPLSAAKNIPKLIAFDFLHGILRPMQ